MPKASSKAILSPSISRESAPRSFTNSASLVTSDASTPSCLAIMSRSFCRIPPVAPGETSFPATFFPLELADCPLISLSLLVDLSKGFWPASVPRVAGSALTSVQVPFGLSCIFLPSFVVTICFVTSAHVPSLFSCICFPSLVVTISCPMTWLVGSGKRNRSCNPTTTFLFMTVTRRV